MTSKLTHTQRDRREVDGWRTPRYQRARIALPVLAAVSLSLFAASCTSSSSSSSASSASSGISYASVQQVEQKLGAHGSVCPLGLDPASAGKTAGINSPIIASQFLLPNAIGSVVTTSPSGGASAGSGSGSGAVASIQCDYLVVNGANSGAVEVLLEAVKSGAAIDQLGLASTPGDQAAARKLSAFIASFKSSPPPVGQAVSVPGANGASGAEQVELVRLKTSGGGNVLLGVSSPASGQVAALPSAQLLKFAEALAAQIKLSS